MFPRKGVPIKEMNEAQRKLAHDLLKAGLGDKGYLTATAIMDLEVILHAIENSGGRVGKQVRDSELYFFTIFGTPSPKTPWGWRVEGHHVSLHFSSPTAPRSPARRRSSAPIPPKCVRTARRRACAFLDALEDTARALLATLDETQKKSALIAEVAPNEIVTNTRSRSIRSRRSASPPPTSSRHSAICW